MLRDQHNSGDYWLDWVSTCNDEEAEEEDEKWAGRQIADFYHGLPEMAEIFRGCSADRVRAISWTTDREVALDFAGGHRGIRVKNPVLATAKVRKEDIFAAVTLRKESEVIIDPRRLRKLVVTPHTRRQE
jgi:hypothetical protein